MIADPQKHESDGERFPAEATRHRYFRTATCILIVCAIGAAAWLAYPALKQEYASLAAVPAVAQAVATLRAEVHEAEQKAAEASPAQQSALRAEADRLAREVLARMEAATRRASDSAQEAYNQLQQRVETEIQNSANRLESLSARLSTLESSFESEREAHQTQLAELRQEVGQLREQASEQSEQMAKLRGEVEQASSGATEQITSVRRDEDRDHRDIEALTGRISMEKIPFEATRHHDTEVGDGISLYVSSADVEYRRISGWMWLASDGRTIWLRNQGAQQPVIFYGYRDGARRELVVTNVAAGSVTGYLLVPRQAALAAEAGSGGE